MFLAERKIPAGRKAVTEQVPDEGFGVERFNGASREVSNPRLRYVRPWACIHSSSDLSWGGTDCLGDDMYRQLPRKDGDCTRAI
jgi:hypothetical protein